MPTQQRERRREARLSLAIPVRVHGYEPDGDVWADVSAVDDVSSSGVSFVLERAVAVGQVLRLDLPLPRTLRAFDVNAPTHRVYVLVRHVTLAAEGYRVGTMFFGKEPPRGFESNPSGRFLLPWDVAPAETQAARPRQEPTPPEDEPADPEGRRRSERFEILVNLLMQQADEWGEVLKEELTVTDNVSAGGAQVRTSLELRPGDIVLVRETDGTFESRAEVCASSTGPEGIRRLHLHFLDGKTPKHLTRRR